MNQPSPKTLKLSPSETLVYNSSVQLLNRCGMKGALMPAHEPVDWEEVLKLLQVNKLVMMIYPFLEQKVSEAQRPAFDREYQRRKNLLAGIYQETRRIIPVLNGRNLPFSLSKGFILGHLLYDDVYGRDFSDVDILVNEGDLPALVRLLLAEGFRSASGSEEIPLHTSFWELALRKTLRDSGEMWIEVKRIHSSFTDKHIEFFRNATAITELDGCRFPIPHLLAQFILALGAGYKNSDSLWRYSHERDRVRLRDYVDLGVFILRHGTGLDVDSVVRTLESLEYGHQAKVVLNDLCSLYPSLVGNEIVSAVTGREWARPAYSLYYPDLAWRSPVLNRILRRDEARIEFVELLKEKWFDPARECAATSDPSGNLEWKSRLTVVGTTDTIDCRFQLDRQNGATLEVEIPSRLLVPGNQYSFVLPAVFEDSRQVYPPRERIEIRIEDPAGADSRSGTEPNAGTSVFKATVSAKQFLKDRTGPLRLCASPVFVQNVSKTDSNWKALTEDHLWKMPSLLTSS